MFLAIGVSAGFAQDAPQSLAEIQVVVRSEAGPVPHAQVVVSGNPAETDAH